jgi:hypothetical protein
MRKIPTTPASEKRDEVPRQEWKTFFQQFTQDHEEWLVSVAGQDKGNQTLHEVNGLPFEALTLHLDDAHEVLSILVRNNDVAQEHVYLSIPRPRSVMVETAGPDVKLHIDSIDRPSTSIRFHRVATPDYNSDAIRGISENEGHPEQS